MWRRSIARPRGEPCDEPKPPGMQTWRSEQQKTAWRQIKQARNGNLDQQREDHMTLINFELLLIVFGIFALIPCGCYFTGRKRS